MASIKTTKLVKQITTWYRKQAGGPIFFRFIINWLNLQKQITFTYSTGRDLRLFNDFCSWGYLLFQTLNIELDVNY